MKKRILFIFMVLGWMAASVYGQTSYCVPSYKGYGWNNNTNTPNSFYTHIKNVTLGDLNANTAAPLTFPSPNYIDYTTDTVTLTRSATYPVSVFLGNGANSQTMAMWIDFNQNNVFEATERVLARFDQANVGTHIITANVSIPANAKTGYTRLRVGTKLGNTVPDPCTNNDANTSTFNWAQQFQDFTVKVLDQATQTFVSCTNTRNNFDEVTPGSSDNVILGIEVRTNLNGTLSPLKAGDFVFSTLGTTNAAELSGARLYYTGLSPTFSTSRAVGAKVNSPGNGFTIKADTFLLPGVNYFWLAFDISSSAILGNAISARCNSVQVSGINRNPITLNPGGDRNVGYCVSKGTQMNFIAIYNVQYGNMTNSTFFQQFSPYGNYTNRISRQQRGSTDTIRVQLGNGVNTARVRAWIDWNGDGDLIDAGEMVLDTFNFNNTPANATYPILSKAVTVPANARVGKTRMRVSTQQLQLASPTPCTNPIIIGEVEDYTVEIFEDGQPVADFKYNISCLGNATDFYDASYTSGSYSITDWHWDFGDGDTDNVANPSHTYANAGTYNVTLTVNTNLPGTPSKIIKAVTVENPMADFMMDALVYQTPITFTDVTSGGNVVFWRWDFGDPASGVNNTGVGPTVKHTFDTAGTYQITLIVSTAGGCMDTLVKTVRILSQIQPIADFTANTFNPYIKQSVSLTDQSVNKPDKWKWTFNPTYITYLSGNDSSQNPVVRFDSLLTYTVFLEAGNAAGSTTTNKTFIVKNYTKPVAGFEVIPTLARVGEQVAFLDTSLNDPTQWAWEFGDTASGVNDTSTLQFPYHAYGKAGQYNVKLKVTNPAGADSLTRNRAITVTNSFDMCDNTATVTQASTGFVFDSGGPNNSYNDGSSCGFLINPPCAGKIVISFQNLDMQNNDYVQIFDGKDDVTGIPMHPGLGFTGKTIPGVLTLTSGMAYIKEISDATGNSAGFGFSWTAFANSKPKARILSDTAGFINSPFSLRNGTTDGYGNIYYWDIDNDGVDDDSSVNAKATYSSLGQKTVRLIVKNCAGVDTTFKTFNIKNPTAVPVARFIADRDTVFAGDIVQLIDQSTNGPTSWLWEFYPSGKEFYDQGTDPNSQNPFVGFSEPGNYTVCLTAYNSVGASVKVCRTNIIIVKEQARICVFPFSTTTAAGVLFDDGGAVGNYSDNQSCNFLIEPCADNVNLTFKKFDLSSGDYLRIYDGRDNTGVPLFRGSGFTGNTLPPSFTAHSGTLYIEFSSDFSGNSAGFEAEWQSSFRPKGVMEISMPDSVMNGEWVSLKAIYNDKAIGESRFEWDLESDLITDATGPVTSTQGYSGTVPFKTRLTVNACAFPDTTHHWIKTYASTLAPAARFMVDQKAPQLGEKIRLDNISERETMVTWTITPNTFTWENGTNANSPHPLLRFTDTGYYDVKLSVSNSQGADSITEYAFIQVVNYCKPSPSLATGVGISHIKLAGFQRNSSMEEGYADNAGLGPVARLENGSAYDIELSKWEAGVNQNWRAWIDWDRNGTFSTSEIILNAGATSNTAVSSNFKVSNSQEAGIYRLRLAASFNNNANTPCNVFLGEVEDYLIEVGNDLTPPVITLLGNNPDTVEQGMTYTEKGAIAIDNVDGNISYKIQMSGTVNTAIVGTYNLTYQVSDTAGNAAVPVVRQVWVKPDGTAPEITLTGGDTVILPVWQPWTEPGFSAIDIVDGNRSAFVVISGRPDSSKIGDYLITYEVGDLSKNFGSRERWVLVRDTTRPVITLNGNAVMDVPCNSTWTDPGALVSDNYDTLNSAQINVSGIVNTTASGTYILTYRIQDKSGNVANVVTRTVKVDCSNRIDIPSLDAIMLVYPNPIQDVLTMQMKGVHLNIQVIRIMNAQGQEMGKWPVSGKTQTWIVPTENWAAGVYIILAEDAQGNRWQKRMVKP